VRACVVVKTLTEAFQRYVTIVISNLCSHADTVYSADTDRDGWVQLNYEQFMKVCKVMTWVILADQDCTDCSQCAVIAEDKPHCTTYRHEYTRVNMLWTFHCIGNMYIPWYLSLLFNCFSYLVLDFEATVLRLEQEEGIFGCEYLRWVSKETAWLADRCSDHATVFGFE
jgi:hypothetical protein